MAGVYIPGMEMPKRGHTVTLTILGGGEVCVQYYDCKPHLTVPIVYKAVPVPDHGRQDGLYSKYFVIKTETGEIVQDCFVLRPQKDKAAVAALLLYAKETENQELSADIRGWLSTIIPADKEETT